MRTIKKIVILWLFALICPLGLIANEAEVSKSGESTEKFNPKDLIFEHIKDSYEWHITKIGETNVAIPLPVMVYSTHSGFHFFLSNKLHGSEGEYEGFRIAKEGANQMRLVEVMSDGTEVRPWDFSITKHVFSLFISVTLLIVIFLSISKRYQLNPARPPKGLQSWIEPIILFVRDDVAKPSIGEGKHERFLPYLLTIFFFIFLNNVMGLFPTFPGGANLTGDISITLVLAIFTFILTNINGSKDYFRHLINAPGVPWWLKLPIPLMPMVEILSVFIKPFVLMIRLFANITAGHIIALGIYSFIFIFAEKGPVAAYGVSVISVGFTVFMALLELLVAFIQAYVFTLLSAIYIGMAMESHSDHHAELKTQENIH